MDDVAQRLGALESTTADIKSQISTLQAQMNGVLGQVSGLVGQMNSLVAQMNGIAAQVGAFAAVLPHLATKADVAHVENSMLRWLVATVIAAMGLVFVIAKYT